MEWIRPADPEDRAELAAWCNGVGPPLVLRSGNVPVSDPRADAASGEDSGSGDGSLRRVRRLVVVSWNVGVGSADLDRFVGDLAAGRVTGAPVRHFVLLLQETFSRRDAVPVGVEGESLGADRIGEPSARRARSEIGGVARKRGLHVVYVPSMRNGRPGETPLREDRGNAILSSLPLSRYQAIELPVQAQRRVAVAAAVSGADQRGRPWRLRLASVHLDHHASWSRFYRSFGAGRAHHATFLVDVFGDAERAVVGGDFNTWFGEDEEPAVEIMRAHFPLPADPPARSTLHASLLPDLLVDHLFFRLPSGWAADYRVVEDRYGSDHHPLVGWIEPAGAVRGAAAGAR